MPDQELKNGGFPFPTSPNLTESQQRCLRAIQKHVQTARKMPSYKALARLLGIASASAVEMVDFLRSRKHIVPDPSMKGVQGSLLETGMLNPYHLNIPVGATIDDSGRIKTCEEWPYDTVGISDLYSPGHLAIKAATRSLAVFGILSGDVIVVDTETPPEIGDWVVGTLRTRGVVYGRLKALEPRPEIAAEGWSNGAVQPRDLLGVVRSVVRHWPVRTLPSE
jgi:SOS-response transcriptional repressor LexA